MNRMYNTMPRWVGMLVVAMALMMSLANVYAQNNSPLCFTARNGSVTVGFNIKNVTHTIQYSTDGRSWSTYTSNTNVSINANQSIYFRAATDQTVATAFGNYFSPNSSWFFFSSSNGGTIEGSGNIMSLYGPSCPNLPLQQYAFSGIFNACTLLTTAPALPATTLANYCYQYMFHYCTSLTTAPALPATTLTDYCYQYMFLACTSLTTAPALPATTLATYCYQCMFSGCTSLITVPALPATALAVYCYQGMFGGCTSLTTVPALPATFLGKNCYNGMFQNCLSLRVDTSSPGKPWIILATSTVYGALTDMFAGTCGTMHGTPSVNTTYYIASWTHYDVNVNANNTAFGSVSGTGLYYDGDTVVIVATPNPNCHLVAWSDGNKSNPRYVLPVSDTSFTAIFDDKYTVSVSNPNGTVTGTGRYDYGDTITLTAIPNEHYHVIWPDGDTATTKSFTVTGDTTFTSVFEIDKHTITAYSEYGTVTGVGTYDYGSTIALTVEKGEHYHFARWSDGNTANPRYVTVACDSSFTAIFEIDKHNVAVNVTNGTVEGTGTYDYGSIVELTAIPDDHYCGAIWWDGDTSMVKNITLQSDTTLSVSFTKCKYVVSATCEHGTTHGDGVYEYGDYVQLDVVPDEGYRFVMWSDSDLHNPRAFVISGDFEVEAYCEEAPVVSVENVDREIPFCYVDGRIVNPEGEMLRVYSAAGVMVRSGDGDITLMGLAAGVYMIVDEKGRAMKVVVKYSLPGYYY